MGRKIVKSYIFNSVLDKQKVVDIMLSIGTNNELVVVADVECKQQTGFIDAWHKVLDEVEEREVKNNLTISSIMYSAPECYPDVS